MVICAKDIASLVSGHIIGDENIEVHSIKGLKYADKRSISFLQHNSSLHELEHSDAAIILIQKSVCPTAINACYILVENVMQAVQLLSSHFAKDNNVQPNELSQSSAIHQKTQLGKNVGIGPFCVVSENSKIGDDTILEAQVFIGNQVTIGKNCRIHSGVKIYANTIIGNDVIIHSNAVIGSDGFGYHFNGTEYQKIHHSGKVIIEDKVEIGSNSVIDRATFDHTIVREGTKLDNLIQIAHNVEIGQHTVIASQTGVSGSVEIGNYCRIGGQVGIAGHLSIADGSQIQAKSGVPSSLTEANQKWYGYPVLKYRHYLRSYAIFKQLPQLVKLLTERRMNQPSKS